MIFGNYHIEHFMKMVCFDPEILVENCEVKLQEIADTLRKTTLFKNAGILAQTVLDLSF